MKLIAIYLLLHISVTKMHAQPVLYNTDLNKPDSNILFIGKNRLKLATQLDFKTLKITSKKSKVIVDDNYIIVTPYNLGIDTISILKGNKLIVSKIYHIQKRTFPLAQLAFSIDSIISIEKILSNPILNLVSLYRIKSDIVNYTCTVTKKSENIKPYNFGEINGFWLTQDIIEIIKTLKSGDSIKFNNIKVLGADTRGLILKPLCVIIK